MAESTQSDCWVHLLGTGVLVVGRHISACGGLYRSIAVATAGLAEATIQHECLTALAPAHLQTTDVQLDMSA